MTKCFFSKVWPRLYIHSGARLLVFSQFKTDKNVFISVPEFFQERFQISFADEILVDQSQSFNVFIDIFVKVKLLCHDGVGEEKASCQA